jgi:hypothetical protein
MKKLLLLSLLVLFGCSKDSEEEVLVIPGIEIVGNYTMYYNGWDNETKTNVGTISFNNNFKGSYNIDYVQQTMLGAYPEKRLGYFDWSFNGSRWEFFDEYGKTYTIMKNNGEYKIITEGNGAFVNGVQYVYFR